MALFEGCHPGRPWQRTIAVPVQTVTAKTVGSKKPAQPFSGQINWLASLPLVCEPKIAASAIYKYDPSLSPELRGDVRASANAKM